MSSAKGILVLGASGFIGQQLIQHLPLPLYVLSRQVLPQVKSGVQVLQTQLDDLDTLKKVLPQCRWLIHLASDSTPGISAGKPLFEAERNLLPNLRLFELLQDYPQVNLLYLSSGGAVYGNPPTNLVSENMPLQPLSYYAAGKIALEAFVSALVQQSPRHALILRPSNVYGPVQKYRAGFGIIPTIFEYQRLGKTLQIWGDGESIRDYLFIEDLVALILLLLQQSQWQAGMKIYNVGAGYGYSLNQLCALIEAVTEQPVLREYHPARAFDVRHIVLDVTRLKNDYMWQAKTSLPEGLQRTWQWWQTQN